MTAEETRLLTRCLALQAEIEATEPPEWQRWVYDRWRTEFVNGPAYAISRWFGPTRERDRMRYRRALDVLESQGLVELYRENGLRLSHVRLTDEGEEVARRLTTESEGAADA